MPQTIRDIVTDAMREILVIGATETPSNEDMDAGVTRFNRMMDRWAAQQIYAFNVNFATFNLQANHSPHTIGPGADFNVAQRPVYIASSRLVLGSGVTAVDLPMDIRDDDWWADNPLKAMQSSIPNNLYYSPDWPNGNCYFWPVSTQIYTVRLELWGTIVGPGSTQDTAFTLPPGYWDAVVQNLALLLAPAFGSAAQVSPLLVSQAKDALRAILQNNNKPPRISTDSGMANSRRSGRPDFNFLTGLRE